MNATEARAYLQSFINYELLPLDRNRVTFKLDRVHKLLELVGNPHHLLKVIHIAGSKGKGSTCAILASILKEQGFKVGLYTSPHLDRYRERIRICSSIAEYTSDDDIFPGMISEEQLAKCLETLKPAVERITIEYPDFGRISFFELVTVLAFLFFHQERVDWVILETGIGGRLDATNVCRSTVAVITPISFEHMGLLGNTLTEIAREKAAIIKADTKYVVIAPQTPEALKVFQQRCQEFKKKFIYVGEDVDYKIISTNINEMAIDVYGPVKNYEGLVSNLIGEHQAMNIASAIGICRALESENILIEDAVIRRAVANVFWPGRLEVILEKPIVILDGAHNAASAEHLVKTLRNTIGDRRIIAVIGTSVDKDIKGICQAINSLASQVIFTRANHPRAHTFTKEEINRFVTIPSSSTLTVSEAMAKAMMSTTANDIILVTGSIFVVGEARQWARQKTNRVIASEAKQSQKIDCFVANAPRNDNIKI